MPEKKKKKTAKTTAGRSKRKTKAAHRQKQVKKKVQKPEVQGDHSLSVHDLKGKLLETLKVDPIFQNGPVHTDVIYQAVVMYQAGQREGTASTKDRGHVRGGGKKPWRQKGTGQARHGSRRSPIWRGGGTTFGPMPRDYSYALPEQIRKRAVVEVVKDKILNSRLYLVNHLEFQPPKTKFVAEVLDALKLQKPLFLVDQRSANLDRAARNLPRVTVKTAREVNALDLALSKECVMTKAAYQGLVERLKG